MFITECAGHTYGVECKQSCGNCSGGVQCDHVTGNCPNGCDAGMYGDKCDLGIARFKFNIFFRKGSVMGEQLLICSSSLLHQILSIFISISIID